MNCSKYDDTLSHFAFWFLGVTNNEAINCAVEFTNMGFVKFLASHDAFDLLTVDVVVFVKVDGDVSHCLFFLYQQFGHSRFALLQDLLHLVVNQRPSLLTQLLVFQGDVACFFAKHTPALNGLSGNFGGILQVATTACGDLIVANVQFLCTMTTHGYVNPGLHFLLVDAQTVRLGRCHVSRTQRTTSCHNRGFVKLWRMLGEVASHGMASFVECRIQSFLLSLAELPALDAHHDTITCVFEVVKISLLLLSVYCLCDGRVHQVFNLSPCEARSHRRQLFRLNLVRVGNFF